MTMPADLSTRAQQCAVQICRDVAELPDYTSPEYQPDVMLCTAEELSIIVERAFAEHASQAVAAEPEAWLVEWVVNGETWVEAFANEPSAVDRGRQHGGTCTPLYRRNEGGNHAD